MKFNMTKAIGYLNFALGIITLSGRHSEPFSIAIACGLCSLVLGCIFIGFARNVVWNMKNKYITSARENRYYAAYVKYWWFPICWFRVGAYHIHDRDAAEQDARNHVAGVTTVRKVDI